MEFAIPFVSHNLSSCLRGAREYFPKEIVACARHGGMVAVFFVYFETVSLRVNGVFCVGIFYTPYILYIQDCSQAVRVMI